MIKDKWLGLLSLACLGLFLWLQSASRMKPLLRAALPSLVIVPGHGMFVNSQWIVAPWLEPFVGDVEDQIKYALAQQSHSVVVFSGGQTNRQVGRLSEAESYRRAAVERLSLDTSQVVLEEYALDSFQNLVYSICRYKQQVGRYPMRVKVVGFEFKRDRFVGEHARAIGLSQMEYVGFGNAKLQHDMEVNGVVKQFRQDLFGCLPPLSIKRAERNVYNRQHPYLEHCPELAELLAYCGGAEPFPGPLPWTRL
ncbi:hypothetical protein BASA81_002559 [Batrachochytrium salamandrivorans]|nr:hypothetical protein BASA81_002559 [Batrachochytrium salamandrivorans]